MSRRRIAIVAAATVIAGGLVSCALISGAGDLVVNPDEPAEAGRAPEAGASDADSDVVLVDASSDGDASDEASTCDEPGLVARWTFDEGAGVVVRDCTRFHHDGRVDGGYWVDGERDGGMAFDGGWVGFGNPPGLQLGAALTACAWIRPAALPPADPDRGYIVSKLLSPTGGGWRLAVGRSADPSGPVNAALNLPDGDGGFHETKGGAMAIGAWSHICAVFAGNTQAVFVDGKQVASSATNAGTIKLTNAEVRIGIRADGTEPYDGTVDDVRVYARALSDAEIALLAVP
jgi:hypothetical protein